MSPQIDAELDKLEREGKKPTSIRIGANYAFDPGASGNVVWAAPVLEPNDVAPVYGHERERYYRGVPVTLIASADADYWEVIV